MAGVVSVRSWTFCISAWMFNWLSCLVSEAGAEATACSDASGDAISVIVERYAVVLIGAGVADDARLASWQVWPHATLLIVSAMTRAIQVNRAPIPVADMWRVGASGRLRASGNVD
jgi:hypothetical protein